MSDLNTTPVPATTNITTDTRLVRMERAREHFTPDGSIRFKVRGDVWAELEDRVAAMLRAAARRAHANGRSTVKPCDL